MTPMVWSRRDVLRVDCDGSPWQEYYEPQTMLYVRLLAYRELDKEVVVP